MIYFKSLLHKINFFCQDVILFLLLTFQKNVLQSNKMNYHFQVKVKSSNKAIGLAIVILISIARDVSILYVV